MTAKRLSAPKRAAPTPAVTRPPIAAADPATASAVASPAAHLQAQVQSAFAEPVVENRWSPRRTLAFVVLTCGSFWAALAFAVSRLF